MANYIHFGRQWRRSRSRLSSSSFAVHLWYGLVSKGAVNAEMIVQLAGLNASQSTTVVVRPQ